ncbi:hypothetical protein VSWAT3_23669 [Vibrionales bacterium SWAT-3]|nr:hypothetical protein VSWAT3_23669 [Vibrionales bacterium SWAT-3]
MVAIRGVMICELDRVVVTKPLFTKGYKVNCFCKPLFLMGNIFVFAAL